MKKKLFTLLLMAAGTAGNASAQWNTGATPVCIQPQLTTSDYEVCTPKMARTADKKTWIAWKSWKVKMVNGINGSSVRTLLQLLDIDGKPQFAEPIVINDHLTPTWWSEYALCVAPDGSAIITVADSRTEEDTYVDNSDSPQTFTPAIYKIDQQGNFLWGLDGVEFRDIHNSAFTNAYVVGDDTYFLFLKEDYENDGSAGLYMMRIDSDGVPAWSEPRLMTAGNTTKGQILALEDGEFLFFDDCPDGARVHRFDRDLNEVWGEPVIYDDHSYGGYEMNHYRIVSDGQGGACVAFQRAMGQFSHNIRAQHINGDGSLGFGLTGLDAYNADEYDHNYPSIAANGETGEILVQFASDLGETGEIRHQKFSYDGDYLYNEKGNTIASKNSATSGGYFYGVRGVGALPGGDWISIYTDIAGYNKASIIVRRYDKDGTRVWTRTIGRDLGIDNMSYAVEPEAVYLIYRESQSNKQPGIKAFRIATDGTYNVDYTTGIANVSEDIADGPRAIYDANGRQRQQLQRGLNIVRNADGTVQKYMR